MFTKLYKFISHSKKLHSIGGIIVGSVISLFFIILLTLVILLHQFVPLVPHIPTLLGFSGPKNYLILFQNNMELRPGGGFIGSFATITVHNGKFGKLEVHNTYDADGQLKKHVEPYYISRRFLQVHLYMRDSNFDVDFARSAQKVAYMYQRETGRTADGVIAIDLSYVKSLVAMMEPIYVWQYNKTVDVNNFFWLTELQADRHSFYGSTQKQDFLQRLFESMQLKLEQNKLVYAFAFLTRSLNAVQQKHFLFESQDRKVQDILRSNNLSSTLYDPRVQTPHTVNDFLGINEANIGVNKSNYFLTRTIKQKVTIDASGKVLENLTLTYRNASPKEQWPTGRYIPYIRLILPHNAKLLSISIDGQEQHIVPAVTDFLVYEAPHFTPPDGLEVDRNEEEGKTIYGFRTLVSYHSTQTIIVKYSLADTIDLSQKSLTYNHFVFKQPGTDNDTYTFSLSYPNAFKNSTASEKLSKTQGMVSYNSPLLTDKHMTITLTR